MKHIKQITEKLDSFIDREFDSTIANISFLKNGKNSYELFKRFVITKQNSCYRVEKKYTFSTQDFSTLQNAVTYCILEYRNKVYDSQKLIELDRFLTNLNSSISLHEHLIKKNNKPENILIYYSKLTDEKVKKHSLLKEISKLINETKIWQNKQFAKIPKS